MSYNLIQYNDIKSKKISHEFKTENNTLLFIEGSPLTTHVKIFLYIIKKGKPNSVIYRYLNDYPSLFKTFLRAISEIMSVFLIKVFNINLIWICHNVDKESKENYPIITKFRRGLFARVSRKILVTDKLLIKTASKQFPKHANKIDYITFGPNLPNTQKKSNDDITLNIKNFIARIREESSEKTLVGLCVSSPNEKNLSYEEAIDLLTNTSESNYKIVLIFVGEISESMRERDEEKYKLLENHPDVFLVNKKIPLNEEELAPYIDFYWRVYSDQSVPFTVYNAATLRKPVLTKNIGFLGQMVHEYSLGYTIFDYNDLNELYASLTEWNDDNAKIFLKRNNWGKSAKRLNGILRNF
ncbi:hypothetical protein GLW00_03125 [Halobacillus litoralis]|uniref:Glycosyl transferase family 1 domain-containing protein n=1 Tax=Halobacillus litoralis TaxID=45668 RepID=A0A845F821_9BACI|nr:glycosyltransferase [Halobacillus litoralis]MYL69825.1 hypothetical protein [Halobacillus litoralis]